MRILIRQSGPDVFVLHFDETEIALNRNEVKLLLLELTKTLLPDGAVTAGPRERALAFMQRIVKADDVGVQRLLGSAAHEDLLILLKLGEEDEALTKKLYDNMSQRSRKIFAEDLTFRFSEGVPERQIATAISSLTRIARRLEDEGSLTFRPGD